jgi:hypothetical protein
LALCGDHLLLSCLVFKAPQSVELDLVGSGSFLDALLELEVRLFRTALSPRIDAVQSRDTKPDAASWQDIDELQQKLVNQMVFLERNAVLTTTR